MHILAIANAGEIDLTLNDFEELSGKIHQIVKINPSSTLTMADFHNAGGVPALIQSLNSHLKLDKEITEFYKKFIETKKSSLITTNPLILRQVWQFYMGIWQKTVA